MAGFFNQLDPRTQSALMQAAHSALGQQMQPIGKNPAGASRVREYLAGNDAYAQELANRMKVQTQTPPDPNAGDRSGVSDFQRQNDAFMKLQGDDLTPAPKAAAPARKSAPKKAGPVNVQQDEATHDGHRDRRPMNVEQDEATSNGHRDRIAPNGSPQTQPTQSPQTEAPQGNKDQLTAPSPLWMAVLGMRPHTMPDAVNGGRGVPSVRSNTTPSVDGGEAIGLGEADKAAKGAVGFPRQTGDNIEDAQWTDAHVTDSQNKMPTRDAVPQLPPQQRRLAGPPQQGALPMIAQSQGVPETADFSYNDLMNELGNRFAGDTGAPSNPNELGETFARDAGNVEGAVDKSIGRASRTIRGKVPRVKE